MPCDGMDEAPRSVASPPLVSSAFVSPSLLFRGTLNMSKPVVIRANIPAYGTTENHKQVTIFDGGHVGYIMTKGTNYRYLRLMNGGLLNVGDVVTIKFDVVSSKLPVDVFVAVNDKHGNGIKKIYAGKNTMVVDGTIEFTIDAENHDHMFTFVEVPGASPYSTVKFEKFDVDISFSRPAANK